MRRVSRVLSLPYPFSLDSGRSREYQRITIKCESISHTRRIHSSTQVLLVERIKHLQMTLSNPRGPTSGNDLLHQDYMSRVSMFSVIRRWLGLV